MWPIGQVGSRVEAVDSFTSTQPTAIVASATANTKGAWAQVVASTPWDADGFYLSVFNFNDVHDSLVDIAIGAGGSEVVILENLLFSASTSSVLDISAYIPIPIKAGTRIAARVQTNEAAANTHVINVSLVAGNFYSALRCGRATTYGANVADSGGIAIDPGAVANTKGAWSEIIAALTNPIKSCLICIGSDPISARADGNYAFDLGVGAAASEQVVIANQYFRSSAAIDIMRPGIFQRHVSIKAGERLAARAQSSITAAGDRNFDITVIGFD